MTVNEFSGSFVILSVAPTAISIRCSGFPAGTLRVSDTFVFSPKKAKNVCIHVFLIAYLTYIGLLLANLSLTIYVGRKVNMN